MKESYKIGLFYQRGKKKIKRRKKKTRRGKRPSNDSGERDEIELFLNTVWKSEEKKKENTEQEKQVNLKERQNNLMVWKSVPFDQFEWREMKITETLNDKQTDL